MQAKAKERTLRGSRHGEVARIPAAPAPDALRGTGDRLHPSAEGAQ
ncbi:MAG: hypothetical protein RMN52_12785 [Anaerolineae bacterium]|nr:hypothetical protein [Candidatus Roseilinea sp.]MDW8450866.1 hypothetical protein [Anaerolineae bacterium]